MEDTPESAVSLADFTAAVNRLETLADAAADLHDPTPALDHVLNEAEGVLSVLGVGDASLLAGNLGGLHEAVLGYCQDLKEELVRSRKRNRDQARRQLQRSALIDLSISPDVVPLKERMTAAERDAWRKSPEDERTEARRRFHVLHRMNRLDSTAEREDWAAQYREEQDAPASIDSFYRWRGALQRDGIPGLLPNL